MNRNRRLRAFSVFISSAMAGTAWGAGATYQLGDVMVTAPGYDYSPAGASTLDRATLDKLRPATSDSAGLLRDVPGVSLHGAGGVSGLPAVHGLADDRLRIAVDGMDLIAACPNHMNSPLSYIDPTGVAGAKVYDGTAPVSVGGDNIGGSIVVESVEPQFARPGAGMLTTGGVGAFYRSNGDEQGANVRVTLASERLSVTYTGSTARSGDYKAGGDFKAAGPAAPDRGWLDGDVVGSSAYRVIDQGLDIALRGGNQLFDLKYRHQHIPFEGFPNQRMDMTGNRSDQVDLGYAGHYRWGELKARIYHQKVDHEMQFGDDRQYQYGSAPGMPMDTRSANTGGRLEANILLPETAILRLGAEYQHYMLDDWWPPSGGKMAPNTFLNIHDGRRDRYALFAEWEKPLNARWTSLFGVRHETVKTDAGCVHGYDLADCPVSGSGGTGGQTTDAVALNDAVRGRTDRNWDVTARARFVPDAKSRYEFGLARKSRSPNLYERYAWSNWMMAAVMNNFVGDGNGYVGNPGLKPEVAYTASITANWHDPDEVRWRLRVAPYYSHVEDYIDAVCAGASCKAGQFNVLRYANQSAELYGVDVSGHLALAHSAHYGDFSVSGALEYARGRNKTTGDGLYDIMPLNGRLALSRKRGNWTDTVEALFVAGKHDVSSIRNEIETGGYSLFNIRCSYEWKRARLDFGVENLFDRMYSLPLGGAYLGQGKTMSMNGVPWGIAVPGRGRSIYAGLNYRF